MQSNVSAWRVCSQDEENLESDSNNGDEWWRDSMCSSCSDSDGCLEEVDSKGELFYIECGSETASSSIIKCKTYENDESLPKRSKNWRKGAQGTLMRLVQRHHHQRSSNKAPRRLMKSKENFAGKPPTSFQECADGHSTNKVTFHDNQSGEIRQVHMLLEPQKHNLGRRASLCEALLGLVPGHFSLDDPDDQRIMVAGFIPDAEATRHRKIKIGDWLHSLDGQEISHQNIDAVLSRILSPCMVTVTLQRVAVCDVSQPSAPYFLSKGLEVDQMLQAMCRGATSTSGGSVVLLSMIINQEGYDEREIDDKDEVLYCYPENPHPPLVSTKGVFLTLLHVLSELCHSKIQTSSLILNGEEMHGIYYEDDGNLLLFAFRKCGSSILIAKELSFQFMTAIKFAYCSFTKAALDHKSRLDLLVDCLFDQYSRLLSGQIHHIRHIIPMAQMLALPRETQLDLENALAELGSADIEEKAYSRHRPQRHLLVLGSCLVYKGLTVCSQLPLGLLSHLQSFCLLHGLNVLDAEGTTLRRLIAWKQVYISVQSLACETAIMSSAKHFLLLLGQHHYTLSVLFESKQHSQRKEDILGPPFEYVEQAQNCLDTIFHLGISEVIDTWLEKQLHPLVGESIPTQSSKLFSSKTSMTNASAEQLMRNLRLNSTEPSLLNKAHSTEGSLSLSSLSHKSPKMPSIMKHSKMSTRSSENSEDTCSQSASEGVQPAISDTSSEDSWGVCQDSVNNYDPSAEPYERNFLQGLSVPTKLVEGSSNCFLYYITLEANLGIILASDIGSTYSTDMLLSNFHSSCLALQFTLHESKQNINRPWMNQSVAATTELGVMFECIEENGASEKSTIFWVVGRHLCIPYPREIYVCYEDSISLSLVELAFRLALAA